MFSHALHAALCGPQPGYYSPFVETSTMAGDLPGAISWNMLHNAARVLTTLVCLCFAGHAWPAKSESATSTSLNSAQIVERMVLHNQVRTLSLKQYQSLRHYEVEYHGFSATLAAKMEVEVDYDLSSGKSFHIVSQSGSKLLCDKVLKRAIDSEKEAAQDKGSTALSEANYKFSLAGSETLEGRPAYVLEVEPIKESKFLYRGKIWVDATDFAVKKIEVEPSKNPSFWISRTQIKNSNAKTGDFWLPQHLRSETKVRIGGTAVLTIDYGTYTIVPQGALSAAF